MEYDFGDESLADFISKYDKSLDYTNFNLLIGDYIFKQWDTLIDVCLFYGDAISIYSFNVNFIVQYNHQNYVVKTYSITYRKIQPYY